jgi:hypothetical protein
MFGFGNQQQGQQERQGPDLHVELRVTLEDLYTGETIPVRPPCCPLPPVLMARRCWWTARRCVPSAWAPARTSRTILSSARSAAARACVAGAVRWGHAADGACRSW